MKLGAPLLAIALVAACGNADDPDPMDEDAPAEDPVQDEAPMDEEAPLEDPVNELEDEMPLDGDDNNNNNNGNNENEGDIDPALNDDNGEQ